jgi:hypothetical protein
MNRKGAILVAGVVVASAGFFLCLKGFEAAFQIHKNGPPWYGPVGMGLLGISLVLFVVAAFTSE